MSGSAGCTERQKCRSSFAPDCKGSGCIVNSGVTVAKVLVDGVATVVIAQYDNEADKVIVNPVNVYDEDGKCVTKAESEL